MKFSSWLRALAKNCARISCYFLNNFSKYRILDNKTSPDANPSYIIKNIFKTIFITETPTRKNDITELIYNGIKTFKNLFVTGNLRKKTEKSKNTCRYDVKIVSISNEKQLQFEFQIRNAVIFGGFFRKAASNKSTGNNYKFIAIDMQMLRCFFREHVASTFGKEKCRAALNETTDFLEQVFYFHCFDIEQRYFVRIG